MSIINEALKKAQQQRSGTSWQLPMGGLAGTGESGFNQAIMVKLVIGLVIMAVILGASLSILFYGIWRGKQTENPPVAAAAPTTAPAAEAFIPPKTLVATAPVAEATTPARAPAATTPARASVAVAPPTTLPTPPIVAPQPAKAQVVAAVPKVAAISHTTMQPKKAGAGSAPSATSSIEPKRPTLPIAQAVTKSPPSALKVNTLTPPPLPPEISAPLAEKELPTTPSVGKTAPAAPPPSVQSIPKPVPTPDEQVINYIRSLNVNAIRMAGKDSKVFMNKKVFRLNSTVNSELQIKILKINPKQIVFIDNVGIKYIKRF